MPGDDQRKTRLVPEPPDAFAPRYPEEGADFDRYRNLTCVGEGGMARVYKAFDPECRMDIAIKVLPRGIQTTDRHRKRFQREIQLLAENHAPGVIRAFTCGEYQGWQYFTMELIDGPTLKELSHAGNLPLDRKLQIIRDLADVLGRLHARDIVHRDLKPSNVMFRPNGELVLTDFGIAKNYAAGNDLELTAEDTRHGTPFYMSPDKPSTLKDLQTAKQADIYSLGVVAYELLTGRLPYEVENLTPHECLTVIREEPPRDLDDHPEIPANVASAVMQALAKAPLDRPDCRAFAEQLRQDVHPGLNLRRVAALVLILSGLLLILAGILLE